MLTTVQANAVRSWVKLAIDGCPELEPIPLDRIVWSDQDFPAPVYPYALLSYTGSVKLGASPARAVNGLDELVTTEQSETTIAITIVSKRSDTSPTLEQLASSYVRELHARTRSFVAGILTAAKLAVRSTTVIPNVDRLQGSSQWESRAVLDLTLGHALAVTEAPGVITTAGITGSTTPPTPTRLYLVS